MPATDPVGTFLARCVEGGDLPGATWWVGGGARATSAGAVGRAAIEPEDEPATPDTVWDLASLTKPLATALLAVLLESDGRWSLDEPAVDTLPELSGGPYADVTLLDLACHRSGLPPWRPLYLTAGDAPGYLAILARESPAGPRGEERYSDLGYLLLGFAVERRADRGLDVLFRERIAGPLGLGGIGFGPWPSAAPTERGNRYERGLAGDAGAGHRWRTTLIRGEVHDVNAHTLGGVAGHAGLFGDLDGVVAIARAAADPAGHGPPGLDRRAHRRWTEPAGGRGDRTCGFVLARGSRAARGVLPDRAPGHVGFTGTSVWIDPGGTGLAVMLAHRVHPEVREVDFQRVRAGFHRAAVDAAAPGGPAADGSRH